MGLGPNLLQFTIALAPNQTNQPQTFSQTGSNTVTLGQPGQGNGIGVGFHRASVRIQNSGAAAGSEAQVAIWGMSESIQNQLSTLGLSIQLQPRNTITIAAGNDPNNLATRFIGTIRNAYPDYSNMPDVPFRFECLAGAAENTIPFAASSYTGATSVATILSAIASKMGWGFENSGVNVMISNPYLRGTAIEQVRAIAEHAHINAQLINNVLAIWPRYGTRVSSTTPLIAPPPKGGLIRYPQYTQQGIKVSSLFDPRITMGGQIQVESSLPSATGTWNVYKVDDLIDCLMPKGLWQCDVWAYNPKSPAPIPQA